jgi:hypothetical protein
MVSLRPMLFESYSGIENEFSILIKLILFS